jgi:outer membrane protein TolC
VRLALVAGMLGPIMAGGCSPDFYKGQADAQVYKILRDRKYDTVGYNPEVRVGASAVRNDAPGAASAAEAQGNAQSLKGPGVKPAPGAQAQPARAYEAIPQTVLPGIEPPPLVLPPTSDPYGPLGPWLDQQPETPLQEQMAKFASHESRAVLGSAQERLALGPPAPGPGPVSLDLFGSLAYGVQHSRAYRDQMDTLYIAALDVTLQRHLFEPRPFATVGLNYAGGQSDVAYKSALTATANAGVKQQLPYGGEVVAQGLVSFVRAISDNAADGESAQLALSGSLPLLRGAGLVNLEPLIQSERNVVYQIRAFEDFRRGYAVDVARQYFTVLTSLQSVNNRRQNVENLRALMERARVLFEAPQGLKGRQSFLEVQRAEQSLLQGEDDLYAAQAVYLNAVDDFKLLIGMDVRQELNVLPVSLDVTVPDVEHRDVLGIAERFRLDLQTARDRIDDSRRQVAVTQNGLMPDLNLTAQGQLNNLKDTPAKELTSRALTYSAGINLDLPLDRVAERNTYRQALISYYATRRGYEDLHEQVAADVRTAVRAIRQAQNSVAIQRRSIELALRRLDNASTLLRLGASPSTRDYVEAQSSLLSAQDAYDRAKANLQVQVLTFLRQIGTLRVDPAVGTLGKAMDREGAPPVDPDGNPRPLNEQLIEPGAPTQSHVSAARVGKPAG